MMGKVKTNKHALLLPCPFLLLFFAHPLCSVALLTALLHTPLQKQTQPGRRPADTVAAADRGRSVAAVAGFEAGLVLSSSMHGCISQN